MLRNRLTLGLEIDLRQDQPRGNRSIHAMQWANGRMKFDEITAQISGQTVY